MRRWLLVTLVGLIAASAALFVASSGYAAPLAQALLPNFILRAQTTITVTVSLADGQTVRVPVSLDFTTRHEEAGGYLFVDAHADQQPNLFIAVDDSGTISASMQAIVYSTATPKPVAIAPTLPPPTLAPIVVAPTATQVPLTPLPAPTIAPTPTNPPPATTDNPGLNTDVVTGDIKWRALSVEDLGNKMVSDNQFIEDATTGGRFIRVVVEIDNRGTSPASYWTPELLDSQERTFNEFSGQYSFVPDDQECLFLTLNPGLSKRCAHIYEVAGDAQGLKLKVTDFGLFFGNEAIIELR